MTEPGLSLDAGALLAAERGDPRVLALIERARKYATVHIVPEVVAQTWRGGGRQARLSRLLKADDIEHPVMTFDRALVVGEICARTDHHDIVDVFVAMEASMAGHSVVTSDPDDLRKVDPHLAVIEI
jgi:hypothetical protein